MKKILLLLFICGVLNATTYMGKLEVYRTITVSSEVSGKVIFVNEAKKFSHIKDEEIILEVNTTDEDIELEALNKSLKNQKEILKIQKQNYENKLKVKQLSLYNKNQEKLIYLQTKQIIIDIEKSIENLKSQKSKKRFSVKNLYLASIDIDKGENINIGDKLYSLYDFSKLKIVLYLKPEDLRNIDSKEIYIDGKKSEFKILHISKVKDEFRVSTHKVELVKLNTVINNIIFGQIVTVEFR